MNNLKKIENLVLEAIEDGAFPGANYAIIFKDKAYVNSLGNKALFPNVEKNDISTIYDMASLTKVICTTTAILILMEEGKLRLANLVTKYLPDFPYGNITVFDLVTHTSGLYPDVFNVSKLKDEKQFYELSNSCCRVPFL
jgi:CubicO group peptidase (beta-lactamase class C family)